MRNWMTIVASLATAATLAGFGNAAHAANCAGFTDVDTSSGFCPSVQWVKDRQITLGCTASTYCPSDPTQRIQMAAFLQRLGDATAPRFDYVTDSQDEHLPPAAASDFCVSTATPVATFPRVVTVDAKFRSSLPSVSTSLFGRIVSSSDAFVSADPQSAFGFLSTDQTSGEALFSAPVPLPAGASLQFAVRLQQGAAGSVDLHLDCDLRLRIDPVPST